MPVHCRRCSRCNSSPAACQTPSTPTSSSRRRPICNGPWASLALTSVGRLPSGRHVLRSGHSRNRRRLRPRPQRIGEEHFTVDCYAIPLDCYDVVLGVKYLHTLGPTLWDFDDLCVAFWQHGKHVLWKGIGSTCTDIPPPPAVCTPSAARSPPSSIACWSRLPTSSSLRPGSRRLATVIIGSTCYRIPRRWRSGHTAVPNSRRMCWRPSARRCLSRGHIAVLCASPRQEARRYVVLLCGLLGP